MHPTPSQRIGNSQRGEFGFVGQQGLIFQNCDRLIVEELHGRPAIRRFPGRVAFSLLLAFYDFLAGIRKHHFLQSAEVQQHFPGIDSAGLKGACYYTDTVTDDARLVLRILQEAIGAGGLAANYVKVESLLRSGDQVDGVVAVNAETGERVELRARPVGWSRSRPT